MCGGGARGLAGQPQLRVDVRAAAPNCAGAQLQPLGDLLVAHALATKLEHLALAVAQLADVAGVGPCELVLAQERTHV